MDDLISIIMPLFNSKETLSESIESVLNQTYCCWELLIIDDHSTDGSFELAKEYSEKDQRIKVLQTEINSGTACARNLGTTNAKGNYITFLDSDDLWKPNKLEVQINYIKSHKYAFVYSDYDILKDGKIVRVFSPKTTKTDYKRLLKRNDVGCLTAFYDVEKCGKVFMPLDAPKREDYAAWLDLTKKGTILYKISQNLATYRINTSSLTGNKRKMIRFHYNVYRKHLGLNAVLSFYYLVCFMVNKKLNKY